MELEILTPPPNSYNVTIDYFPNTVYVFNGYPGPTAKTLVAGDNITLDEDEDTITINANLSSVNAIPNREINTFTSSTYTLQLIDAYTSLSINTLDSGKIISVPPNSSVPFEIGTVIFISQYTLGGFVFFTPGSGVSLKSELNHRYLAGVHAGAVLYKIGTNIWYLQGGLTTL